LNTIRLNVFFAGRKVITISSYYSAPLEKGRLVGSVTESGGKKTYLDGSGKLVARVHNNRTFDAKGAFKGTGDQGMRLLGEKPKR
jgi:hypothetical protein